jgi:hypothetical protein
MSERKMLATVDLDHPLKRGDEEMAKLTFRRPNSGELRGLSLVQLGQMNVDEIRKLLPRISMEGLIVEEVDKLDSADIMSIAFELSDFLLPSRMNAAAQ